jgi:uncharacterized membrane protein
MIIPTLQLILLIAQIILGAIGVIGKNEEIMTEEKANACLYSSYGCCILILLLNLL